jgi:dCMP deaminase
VTRPGWDLYFMIIADAVSLRMSCDRARIGAVIVSPDRRILSTGYGGAPSGWPSCDEIGHELVDINGRQSCVRTVHAEENAIVTAARHGGGLDGSTLYTTASCCYDCAKMAAQAGVKRIVYGAQYDSARSGAINIVELMQSRGIEMVNLSYVTRVLW